MNRLTYVNGFILNEKKLSPMEIVDKYNELKAAHDKLKSERLAHYHNEIKKLEAVNV